MNIIWAIALLLSVGAAFVGGRYYEFCSAEKNDYFDKYSDYQQNLLRNAVRDNRQNGRDFLAFFRNRNIKRIAVYGLGLWNKEFLQDIDKEYFDAIYYVDRDADVLSRKKGERVYFPKELLDLDFDMVVITSVVFYKEIKKQLEDAGIQQEIWSYSELVYNVVKEEVQ